MARTVQGIEIDEDRAHERLEWRIERVGWAVMGLLLLAGALGLLGFGPLARASTGQGPLTVDYDRLQRAEAPTQYRVRFDPALARDGVLRLRVDQALLEEVEIDTIIPEPDRVRSGPGFTEFEFLVASGDGGDATIHVQFHPTTFGRVGGHLRVEGAAPLRIDHVVFP